MHLIIFTRALGRWAQAYAQGKGRGNTGKVKKMRKGKQNGNPKKRKKDGGKGRKEDGVKGNI